MNRLFVLTIVAVVMSLPASANAGRDSYPFQRCFEVASRLHNVPVDLLLAVAATESNWDPDARSHANAHGIMQIQWPGTARHLGVRRVAELYNPCLNIELGSRYLRELLTANGNDVERALASYNYGPSRIAKSSTLPAGARKYAATVAKHRERVRARRGSWVSAGATLEVTRFDSKLRARRYARTLNERLESARFTTSRATDGRYAVTMSIADGGLTTRDSMTLEALGWGG